MMITLNKDNINNNHYQNQQSLLTLPWEYLLNCCIDTKRHSKTDIFKRKNENQLFEAPVLIMENETLEKVEETKLWFRNAWQSVV